MALMWRLERVATPGYILKTPNPDTSFLLSNKQQIAEILSVFHVTQRQRDRDYNFIPERVNALWQFSGGNYVTFDNYIHGDKTTWYLILKYNRKDL